MSRHTTILIFCALGAIGCEKSPPVPTVEEKERAFKESAALIELPDEVINAITKNAKNRDLVVSKKSERVKNELKVTTGDFYDGRGEVFTFHKDGDLWKLMSQSVWVD